jgi:hypothetical protein
VQDTLKSEGQATSLAFLFGWAEFSGLFRFIAAVHCCRFQ